MEDIGSVLADSAAWPSVLRRTFQPWRYVTFLHHKGQTWPRYLTIAALTMRPLVQARRDLRHSKYASFAFVFPEFLYAGQNPPAAPELLVHEAM